MPDTSDHIRKAAEEITEYLDNFLEVEWNGRIDDCPCINWEKYKESEIAAIIERHIAGKFKEINDALRFAPCTCYGGDVCGRCRAMGIIGKMEAAP